MAEESKTVEETQYQLTNVKERKLERPKLKLESNIKIHVYHR
jgi:hypothetical protein